MRAYVFTRDALKRHAGQFVWLSIDTEKAGNAPFKVKYPVNALPTYFVLDPGAEAPLVRWVGGATLDQLLALLSEASGKFQGEKGGLEQTLAKADRLYGEGKYAEAVPLFREALRKSAPGRPSYARTVESLLFALQSSEDFAGCVETAREAWPRLRRTASAANVAASGLSCALELPKEHAGRREALEFFGSATRRVLDAPRPGVAADDLSSVYEALAEEREDAGDEEGKRRVLRERAALLESAAGKAGNADARAVFDSHRLSTYLELGEPQRAIPMLEVSERDLPEDYNPPARLALAYKAMKRWPDALDASDRALAKAYGPRRIGILQTRAEIYREKGDPAAARRTLEEALREAEGLPPGQRSERTIESLRKKLAAGRL